jgi:GTP cyclohydrolase IIa
MTIQLTIIRIEEYGQWTTTLGTDRESQLQMLQAKIYYDIQRLFSKKDCIVFSNRFDEFFAVTNCLSVEDHLSIDLELANLYPNLSMSMTIGNDETPYKSNMDAYESRKRRYLLIDGRKIFGRKMFNASNANSENDYVKIMHIDIEGSSHISNQLSPYELTSFVLRIYSRLSNEFLKIESLTFFLGGDNFMIVSNKADNSEIHRIISDVSSDLGTKLKCGIGTGRTGKAAAEASTRALDTIRLMRKSGKVQPIYEIRCL